MSTASGLATHEHVSGLLPAYVNGTLLPDERAAVDAHLKDCSSCKVDLATWQKVQSATRWAMHAAPMSSRGLDQMWTALDALAAPMPTKTIPASAPAFGTGSNLRPLSSNPGTSRPNGLWRRIPVANLATAAVILLTLLASVVAFSGRFRQTLSDEQPAMLPVVTAPEDAALPAGVLEDVTLMQGVFDVIPPDATWTGIERNTMAPGAAWDVGTSQTNGEGPSLYRVESGTLTIQADGPITVTSAGWNQPATVPAGTDVVLSAGDQGYTPSGVKARFRNESDVPVIVIVAGITTIGWGSSPEVRNEELAWSLTENPAMEPALVAVRRVTLEAGAAVPIEVFPGVAVGYVESGQVIAANSLASPTPSSALPLRAPYALLALHPGRVLHVTGPEPATVLLMTINNPNPLEGTPMD